MPHRSIHIRFIRRTTNGGAAHNPATDDILTITRIGENSVRLKYTEKSDVGVIHDIMHYSYHQMMAYLYRVLWLLGLDEDPFQSVQFFVPGYPTVLILATNIKQNVTHILDLIFSTCIAWPTIGAYNQEEERTGTHVLFSQPGVSTIMQSNP
jgi:hypothetical protein